MAIDDGQGFDQPILENGELAIFEVEDGYSLRRFGEGEVKKLPANLSDEFWAALREQGWEDVL